MINSNRLVNTTISFYFPLYLFKGSIKSKVHFFNPVFDEPWLFCLYKSINSSISVECLRESLCPVFSPPCTKASAAAKEDRREEKQQQLTAREARPSFVVKRESEPSFDGRFVQSRQRATVLLYFYGILYYTTHYGHFSDFAFQKFC